MAMEQEELGCRSEKVPCIPPNWQLANEIQQSAILSRTLQTKVSKAQIKGLAMGDCFFICS